MVSARGGGPQGLPFNEVNPSYEADQDIWGRALDLEHWDFDQKSWDLFTKQNIANSQGIHLIEI